MKKLFFALFFVLCFSVFAFADDEVVCGKEFKVTIDYELYILKFLEPGSGLPCTGGYVNFYWQNQYKQYYFQVYDNYYVQILMLGNNNTSQATNFMFRDKKLKYLDPNALTFTEY